MNYPGSALAVQSDGKIVVTGTSINNFNTYIAVSRFNIDGSIDHSFNGTGKIITDFGFKFPPSDLDPDSSVAQSGNSVTIQPDGKILVGGNVEKLTGSNFALVRYNSNGQPDSSFNGNGRQTTNFSGFYGVATSLAIDNNGKIVSAGLLFDMANSISVGVARYNNDGSPDNLFNGTGEQVVSFNTTTQTGFSMAVQNDNKVVVGASMSLPSGLNDFEVARLNANGSIDNSFDGDGHAITDFRSSDDYLLSIAIQNDGKILACGYAYLTTSGTIMQHLAVTRYDTDGELDNSFGNGGKLEGLPKQGSTMYFAEAIQPDGKIVAAGQAWNGNNYDFAIARYNSNGKLDSTFSNDGIQISDFGGTDAAASVAIQTGGKIVVAGNSDDKFAIARYNTDGSPDNTFNGTGRLVDVLGAGRKCLPLSSGAK